MIVIRSDYCRCRGESIWRYEDTLESTDLDEIYCWFDRFVLLILMMELMRVLWKDEEGIGG